MNQLKAPERTKDFESCQHRARKLKIPMQLKEMYKKLQLHCSQ